MCILKMDKMKKVILGAVVVLFMIACDSETEEVDSNVGSVENSVEIDSSVLKIEKGVVELETMTDSLDSDVDEILKGL